MKHLLAIAGLAAAAGCAPGTDAYQSFYTEAGAMGEGAQLGDAVTHNRQIMTGEKSVAIDLNDRFRREVPSTINFAFDSAQMDANARAALRQQADWIRQFPELRFRVYGHTDAVGPQAYNKQLGLRRARAAVNYLIARGISRSRLEAMASFGETQPIVVTDGRERRNRRTVTEVSGFLRSHPVSIDGRYAEVINREYIKSAEPASTLRMLEEGTGTNEAP